LTCRVIGVASAEHLKGQGVYEIRTSGRHNGTGFTGKGLGPRPLQKICRLGVTSRADFRRRYLTGKLSTDHWRCFGKFKRAQLLTWAGLPPPDDVRHEVRLHLDTETFRKLDVLVKANRFRGPDRREKLMARMLRMEWAWQHCPIRKKLRRRSKHKSPQSLE